MTINISNLINVLEQKLVSATEKEVAVLTNVLSQLKLNGVHDVDTFASLPAVLANRGKLYFVADENLVYWSTGTNWISLASSNVELWAVGDGANGTLGDGTTVSKSSPVLVLGDFTWSKIAISSYTDHQAAIKTDGTLWTWGLNSLGQLGDNTTTDRSSPGMTIDGANSWDKVACGYLHTLATKTDGTLWNWGYNAYGQLGDNTTTSRSSPVTTSGGGNIWNNIAVGQNNSIATKTDGTLWTWGYNLQGQLGDNTTTSRSTPVTTRGGGTNWKSCAAARAHCLATKTDGTLWTWGWNNNGRLGDNSTTNRSSPVTTAGGGTNWDKVAGGDSHSIATKTDGTLWTWGGNNSGRLGDNTAFNRSSPVTTAGGGTNWDKVAAADGHSIATKTDGTLWTWGKNNTGQLGDNTTTSRSSPGTTVFGAGPWSEVSGSEQRTFALKDYTQ
jgi:alpha-tubulin suppressor-like RCC1 family protein